MVTLNEYLMNRDSQYPLTVTQWHNVTDLLIRLNHVRAAYGKPMYVSSGYRPGLHNARAGGAKKSAHLECQAVDIADTQGEFKEWCLNNFDLIKSLGLYMEHPDHTPGWVHLQTRPTRNNPFIP